jgi:hypothetical protein
MASTNSEPSGGKVISRSVRKGYLQKTSSLALILLLCVGWVVCAIRCAAETAPGCCGSRFETGPLGAAPIPPESRAVCKSHASQVNTTETQLTITPHTQNLSKPSDGSRCHLCEAQPDGRAVLPRLINNWPLDTNTGCRSALYEIAKPRNEISCLAPVMNRGSTYLLCCVLLI